MLNTTGFLGGMACYAHFGCEARISAAAEQVRAGACAATGAHGSVEDARGACKECARILTPPPSPPTPRPT